MEVTSRFTAMQTLPLGGATTADQMSWERVPFLVCRHVLESMDKNVDTTVDRRAVKTAKVMDGRGSIRQLTITSGLTLTPTLPPFSIPGNCCI
jgi:hypothetical protein